MPGTRKGHLAVLATALAGCTLLTACQSVGPDFVRPDSAWLDDWQDASTEAATAGLPKPDQPPPDDWWRNFNDPVLDQLIAEAQRTESRRAHCGLTHHGSACATRHCHAAGGTRKCNNSPATRCGRANKTTGEPSTSGESYSVGLVVGWEIDFWGKFRRGIESADAAYLASIAQYDDIHVLLAAQVASLYCHHSHTGTAIAHCAGEHRTTAAEPGNHRESVQKRKRIRTGRATSKVAVSGHTGNAARAGNRTAPGAERIEHPARATARPVTGDGAGPRTNS